MKFLRDARPATPVLIAALGVALGLAHAGRACAQTDWRAPRVVAWECAACHGIDGNAELPTMPRLAAQKATYLQEQIAAFRTAPPSASVEIPAWLLPPPAVPENARTGPIATIYMIGPAHTLSAEDAKSASEWYARQTPLPGPAGEGAETARGRELYAKGVPGTGAIACQDCHGADGAGLASFPRLAGQHASYLVRQLQAFASGHRSSGSPMHGIARDLPQADAEAIAAYLQAL
jgi:cytochrome c553